MTSSTPPRPVSDRPARVVVLMGVSGAGKTTVGRAFAEAVGWDFVDADDHHSEAALAKMSGGEGLTDADRAPWLERLGALVGRRLADGPPTVLACSALRASYRDALGAGRPGVALAWLDVPAEVLAVRLAERQGHIAGPDLLPSQLATLETPGDAFRLDATAPVDEIVVRLRQRLGLGTDER